jgi:protein arginine N-methyltransferase 2
MRNQGIDKIPGVRILEGRWQDWLCDPEKMGEVLEGTPDSAGFDAIFVDTFAEGYEGESFVFGCFSRRTPRWLMRPDLKAFFEILLDIIEPQNGVFSFWNGLGATSESSVQPPS